MSLVIQEEQRKQLEEAQKKTDFGYIPDNDNYGLYPNKYVS